MSRNVRELPFLENNLMKSTVIYKTSNAIVSRTVGIVKKSREARNDCLENYSVVAVYFSETYFEIQGEENFLIFLFVQMPLVDVGRGPDEILWQRNDHEVNLLFYKYFLLKRSLSTPFSYIHV
jgi:hypothetical protein